MTLGMTGLAVAREWDDDDQDDTMTLGMTGLAVVENGTMTLGMHDDAWDGRAGCRSG
jgi:hypothetical protein